MFRVLESKCQNFLTLRGEVTTTEKQVLCGSSGISEVPLSPLIDCFYSIAGVVLQLLQLVTVHWPE